MYDLARNLVIVTALVVVAFLFLKPGGESGRRAPEPRGEPRAAAVQPSQPDRPSWPSGYGNEMVLERAVDGHYYVTAEIEGVAVDFLVDTGASMVALTRKDAERIGLYPDNLDYTMQAQTANGVAHFAPVTLRGVAIDRIEVDEVRAAVSQGDMGMSLLGMSFLDRLEGYQVENGNLILYW